MATSIGALIVEFIANTGKFRTDVGEAANAAGRGAASIKNAFNSIGGSVTSMTASMLSFRAVVGTVLGTGGLGLLVKNAVSAGEEIVNMAQRVGVSTTALQELSHAARASGASVSDLEQGLTVLNRRLGEAQAGERAALDAFKAIGVDPAKFRDAGEAIGTVSDGLLTLGTEAQRTASQLDLLGKGSSQLTGLLKEGSAGQDRLKRAAHELGVVLDTELLKKSKELADTLGVLAEVAKVNLMKVLIDLGPILVGIAQAMAAVSKEARAMFEHFFVPDEAIKDIGKLNERIALLNGQIADYKALIAANPNDKMLDYQEHVKGLEARKKALEGLADAQRAFNRAAEPTKKTELVLKIPSRDVDAVEEFRRKLVLLAIPDETARKMVELRIEINKLKAAVSPSLGSAIESIGAAMGALITAAPAAEALKKFHAAVEGLQREIGQLDMTPLGKLTDDALKGLGEGATEEQKNAIRDLVKTLYTAKLAMQETADASKAMAEAELAAEAAAKALTEADRQLGASISSDVMTPLEKYHERMRDLERLLLSGKIAQEAYERSTMAAGKAMADATTGPASDMIVSLRQQREILGLSAREQAQWNAVVKLAGEPTKGQIQNIKDEAAALFDLNEQLADNKLVESLEDQVAVFSMTTREAAAYNAQLRLSAGASEELRTRTAELSAQISDYQESQQRLAQITQLSTFAATSLGNALYDALTGQQESFADSVKQIITALNKMILTMIIAELVARALKAALSSFGGGGGSEGLSGGIGTSDIGRGAKGGVVRHRPGGKLMIVGEAGQDEAIIPLDRMAALGGGGGNVTVVNEIHNHTDAKVTTQQQQMPDGRVINKIIIDTVTARLGDGTFDPVMGASYGAKRRGVSR